MMNNYQRSGKWTREEEEYALAIVKAFHDGTLDIPADSEISLRKYLAKKLMCSPKRVSKKYESSGYQGKQVYARNPKATLEDIQATSNRLQLLESKFLGSIATLKAVEASKRVDVSFPSSRAESTPMSPQPSLRMGQASSSSPLPGVRGPLNLAALPSPSSLQQNQRSAQLANPSALPIMARPRSEIASLATNTANTNPSFRQSILMGSFTPFPASPRLPDIERALALDAGRGASLRSPLAVEGLINSNVLGRPFAAARGLANSQFLGHQSLATGRTPSLPVDMGGMRMLRDSLSMRPSSLNNPLSSFQAAQQIALDNAFQQRSQGIMLAADNRTSQLQAGQDAMLPGRAAGNKRTYESAEVEQEAKRRRRHP